MAQDFVIPGGPKKGLPVGQAETKDLQYWLARIGKALAEDPAKQYADRDRAWVAAAQAELAGRSGQQPLPAQQARPRPAAAQNGGAPAPRTALATRGPDALAGSFSDTAGAAEALRRASEQMHLVSPATHCGALPAGCGIAISIVHVNPDASKDGPGEVYPVSGKLALSGTTLKKIGAAAAIDWNMGESGRLDNGRDPHYCHYRAVGIVRNFDGSARTVSGEVEIDARDGSSQMAKAEEKEIAQTRKFILRIAETKAKLRAIADMGVKRSYNAGELAKPFAVARLMWTGQTDDPALKRLFAEKQFDAMVGGTNRLYGTAAPTLPARAAGHAPPPIGAVAPDEFVDMPLDEGEYDTAGGALLEAPAPPATATAPKPAPREPGDDADEDVKF